MEKAEKDMEFAERLVELRARLPLRNAKIVTLKEVAKEAGVNLGSYSRAENGIIPGEKVLTRIARYFEVSIVILLVILLLSGSIFAIQRAGLYFNAHIIFRISIVLFLSSIGLLYIAFAYNNSRLPNIAKKFRDEEEDFSKKLEKHRR